MIKKTRKILNKGGEVEILKANRNTGSKKKEKGIRKCSQVEVCII
jgi:hypothetical protein